MQKKSFAEQEQEWGDLFKYVSPAPVGLEVRGCIVLGPYLLLPQPYISDFAMELHKEAQFLLPKMLVGAGRQPIFASS